MALLMHIIGGYLYPDDSRMRGVAELLHNHPPMALCSSATPLLRPFVADHV